MRRGGSASNRQTAERLDRGRILRPGRSATGELLSGEAEAVGLWTSPAKAAVLATHCRVAEAAVPKGVRHIRRLPPPLPVVGFNAKRFVSPAFSRLNLGLADRVRECRHGGQRRLDLKVGIRSVRRDEYSLLTPNGFIRREPCRIPNYLRSCRPWSRTVLAPTTQDSPTACTERIVELRF